MCVFDSSTVLLVVPLQLWCRIGTTIYYSSQLLVLCHLFRRIAVMYSMLEREHGDLRPDTRVIGTLGYDSTTHRATQATWADVVKASVALGTETNRSSKIGEVS